MQHSFVLLLGLLSCLAILVETKSQAMNRASDTPSVPKQWPPRWHTWVVTTVTEDGRDKPLSNMGQLMGFDLEKKYSCRYNEQNLLNFTAERAGDYCDYTAGFRYHVNDTYGKCSGKEPLSTPIQQLAFPDGFVDNAMYKGVDKVAQKNCSHFLALNAPVNGMYFQIDVWTSVDEGLPCQISIYDRNAKIHTTWAFDGFTNFIPPNAKNCLIPRTTCSGEKFVCRVKANVTQSKLEAALAWTCGVIDCAPINPGGQFYNPNTLEAHCNWAFDSYYQQFKEKQGEGACDFGGVAYLVQQSPSAPIQTNKRATLAKEYQSVFLNDLICPARSA